MNRIVIKSIVVTLALAWLAASLSAQPAPKPQDKKSESVAGKWTLSAETPHGAMDFGLTLKIDGTKISGVFAPPQGSEIPISGEIKDGTLTFQMTQTPEGYPSLAFKARLKDGGTLAGTGDVTISSGLNWSGGLMTGSGKTIVAGSGVVSGAGGTLLDRTLRIDPGGVLDMQDSSQISFNSTPGNILTSGTGALKKTAGAGTATIAGVGVQGNIDAASGVGSMAMDGPSLSMPTERPFIIAWYAMLSGEGCPSPGRGSRQRVSSRLAIPSCSQSGARSRVARASAKWVISCASVSSQPYP